MSSAVMHKFIYHDTVYMVPSQATSFVDGVPVFESGIGGWWTYRTHAR